MKEEKLGSAEPDNDWGLDEEEVEETNDRDDDEFEFHLRANAFALENRDADLEKDDDDFDFSGNLELEEEEDDILLGSFTQSNRSVDLEETWPGQSAWQNQDRFDGYSALGRGLGDDDDNW